MWPMGLTLAMTLIFEFSKSNVTYTFDHTRMVLTNEFHLVTKVRWKDLPHSDRGDLRCRPAVDSSNYNCVICDLFQEHFCNIFFVSYARYLAVSCRPGIANGQPIEGLSHLPHDDIMHGNTFRSTGWGLLSQFPPFRYFPNFSESQKHALPIEYHAYIWQVSPQLSCGDTCQIWMWSKEYNRYFCKIENFACGEISERSFSNPHTWPFIRPKGKPVPWQRGQWCLIISLNILLNK